MKNLRKWQSECADIAMHYYRHYSHFLCQATPGAGKTTLAAEIAARLIEQKDIEYVLCFAPSITIAEGLKESFSQRLGKRFDGVIGSMGKAMTYQAMQFLEDDFWKIMDENSVLVVFDEIHHCAGDSPETSNSWGEEIMLRIQGRARYTLSLSGTPWRSDNSAIALSHYDQTKQIRCNYNYGLEQAVTDGVCRSPKIVLFDNSQVDVQILEQDKMSFDGIESLLDESDIKYQDVLSNRCALKHLLMQAQDKLSLIRLDNPDAAGLVVASSIAHAVQIYQMMVTELSQSAIIVTHKTPNAHSEIAAFKEGDDPWIISVGMISEGTDIPRLQVCCHLSRIRTELYFRQVLGRILRVNASVNQEAWLFTFAEPSLNIFAEQVSVDLPDYPVIERLRDMSDNLTQKVKSEIGSSVEGMVPQDHELNIDFLEISDQSSKMGGFFSEDLHHLEFSDRFREKVVSVFDSPF